MRIIKFGKVWVYIVVGKALTTFLLTLKNLYFSAQVYATYMYINEVVGSGGGKFCVIFRRAG